MLTPLPRTPPIPVRVRVRVRSGYLPRTLNLGRLEAVPLHLDLLCLHVVALLRQGHLEVEAEVQVEV